MQIFVFTLCLASLFVSIAQSAQIPFHSFEEQRRREYDAKPVTNEYRQVAIGTFLSNPNKHMRDQREPPVRLYITYPLINYENDFSGTKTATYPVSVFLGGMIGLVPIEFYRDLFARISYSGNGMILVAMDFRGIPSGYERGADIMQLTLNWIKNGYLNQHIARDYQNYLFKSKLHGKILPETDVSRIILMSHSSGAQSLIKIWTRMKSSISSLILLDPVDAFGEFSELDKQKRSDINASSSEIYNFPPFDINSLKSLVKSNAGNINFPPAVIDPNNPRQFSDHKTPFLIVSSGLCSKPAAYFPVIDWIDFSKLPPIFDPSQGTLWPACCPRGLGPETFWKALSGVPSDLYDPQSKLVNSSHNGFSHGYHLNFTNFGHCDILDDLWVGSNRLFKFCQTRISERSKKFSWLRDGIFGWLNLYNMESIRSMVASSVSSFVDLMLFENCEGKVWLDSKAGPPKVEAIANREFVRPKKGKNTCFN